MALYSASWRFVRRFLGTTVAYGVLITGATWVARAFDPPPTAVVALSILPALAIAAGLYVMALYLIEEPDEYVRRRHAIAMLVAIGVLLTIATALGFLQQRDVIGGIDLLWVFPAWCVLWAVAQCWMAVRDLRATEDAA